MGAPLYVTPPPRWPEFSSGHPTFSTIFNFSPAEHFLQRTSFGSVYNTERMALFPFILDLRSN